MNWNDATEVSSKEWFHDDHITFEEQFALIKTPYVVAESCGLDSLEPLLSNPVITHLNADDNPIETLEPLRHNTSLRWISLYDCTQIPDIDFLQDNDTLEYLRLYANSIDNIDSMSVNTTLKTLIVACNECITTLEPLRTNSTLTKLNASYTEIAALDPLEMNSTLKVLKINGTRVQSLEPLALNSSLERLDISDTMITDVTPLYGCTALEDVHLNGKISDSQEEMLYLLTKTNYENSFNRRCTLCDLICKKE